MHYKFWNLDPWTRDLGITRSLSEMQNLRPSLRLARSKSTFSHSSQAAHECWESTARKDNVFMELPDKYFNISMINML